MAAGRIDGSAFRSDDLGSERENRLVLLPAWFESAGAARSRSFLERRSFRSGVSLLPCRDLELTPLAALAGSRAP
jgi:hypothetical protein